MNKFTKKELVDLILYNFDKKDKKEIKRKLKKNINLDDDFDDDDDDDDDDDFNLKSKLGNLKSKINIDDVEHNFLTDFSNIYNKFGDNGDDFGVSPSQVYNVGAGYKKKGGSLPVKIIYKSITNGYSYPKIENLDDGFVFSKNGSDKEIQLYVNEKEKRIIINFIGTYTMFDWSNNYYYVLGKYKETKRFKRARDAFIKITDDYQGYKVILIGHSQSAVITNILNQEFPNKIYEVINLNGANLGETERDNEYNIRSKMDLVSLLHKPTKRDIIINNKTNNILTEHKPDVLKRLEQNKKIGR